MKKLMAANWKMYKTGAEAVATLNELAGLLNGQAPEGREIVIFVPFTALEKASDAMKAIKGGMTGAENMYPAAEGAFTGEISPAMIKPRISVELTTSPSTVTAGIAFTWKPYLAPRIRRHRTSPCPR